MFCALYIYTLRPFEIDTAVGFKRPLSHFSNCSFLETLLEWHFLKSLNRGDVQLSFAGTHKSQTGLVTTKHCLYQISHSHTPLFRHHISHDKIEYLHQPLSLYHIWDVMIDPLSLYLIILFGM